MPTLIRYIDPAHSWLRVSRAAVAPIADKISTYSYITWGHVYLEEDCDASIYLDYLKSKNSQYTIKNIYTGERKHCAIRNYPAYHPKHVDIKIGDEITLWTGEKCVIRELGKTRLKLTRDSSIVPYATTKTKIFHYIRSGE